MREKNKAWWEEREKVVSVLAQTGVKRILFSSRKDSPNSVTSGLGKSGLLPRSAILAAVTCFFNASMAANGTSGDHKNSSNMAGGSHDNNSLVIYFGEMLIDFVPMVNEVSLAEAPTFTKAPANVAVEISRLGDSSALIGKVGDDESGYMLAESLKKNSVNNSGVQYDPTATMALAFVTLRADGEREFLFIRHPSADMLLRKAELDINLLKQINEDKISFLTGGDDPNYDNVVLEKLFHLNLKLLIVTEGSEGCRYKNQEFKGRVPDIEVKAIDTTGAGDAFVIGILNNLASDQYLLQDEKRLREALLFANACGAITTTERGAIPALPTRQVVLRLLSKGAARW